MNWFIRFKEEFHSGYPRRRFMVYCYCPRCWEVWADRHEYPVICARCGTKI